MRQRSRFHPPGAWLLIVLICLAAVASLNAQTQNGNIVGTVRDASGGAAPGVTVTATIQQTGVTRTVVTDGEGGYRFALVPLGDYTITAEITGFKKYVNQDIHLATNQTLRVDINLELGEITQQVTVQAEAAAITTDSAGISSIKDANFIKHHPSLVFNPSHLLANASISSSEMHFSFYGSRGGSSTTTVDGAQFGYYNNYVLGYSAQEVKAETLLAPAKYQTSVTTNLVTKQGTNEFHGKADLTVSNAYFAAQSPRNHVEKCSPGRPCTGSWLAGLTATGPVRIPKLYDGRNRTFWMFTATPQKNARTERPTTNIVPNAAQKSGNLSGLSGTIRNPFTGEPFPNNQIPANMINSVSSKLLALYPNPDQPGGTVASVISRLPENVWKTWSGRLDHKISDQNSAMFSFTRFSQVFAYDFADRSVVGYMGLANGEWRAGTFTFGDTHTFSPTVVNEARFGANWEGPTGYFPEGVDVRQRIADLGLTNIPEPRVTLTVTGPDFSIPGFTPFLGWANTHENKDRFYHFSDNLSIQRNNHTLQTGFEYKFGRFDHVSAPTSVWPAYNFDGRFTGNGYADFLLGLPGIVNRTNQRPVVAARRQYWGLYLQDDWRLSQRLTLNLGVRYDYLAPQWEANDLHFNYDPKTGNLVVPSEAALQQIDPAWNIARNPIVLAGQAGFPDRLMKADGNNFYPRVGFAFRPLSNQDFVIRGGYGIFVITDWQTGAYGNSLLQTGGPFGLATRFDNALVNGQPVLQFPTGYPSEGGTFRGTPSAGGVNPNFVYPYNQQWNLTVEKALGGQGLRLSYIGTKDTKLGYTRDINKPMPSSIAFNDSRFINPGYVNIAYSDNGGSASFHSFETNLTLRGVGGFRGEFGYAWAKQMTDVPFTYSEGVAGNTIENPYCRSCERARSEIIPKHRIFAGFTWDVPVGRQRALGRDMPGWLDQIVGNWLISSTVRARTGLGITPLFTGSDPSNTNTFSGRPDLVGDPALPDDQRGPDRWYNPSAFVAPPANAGRYGNAGRNLVEGPGAFRMNLGLFKSFPVNERFRIVFSMTSNNILNKVDYSWGRPPGSTTPINAPNAGFLTSLYEDIGQREINYMRQIFFNLGFEF